MGPSSPCYPLAVLTVLLLFNSAACQIEITDGVCGKTRGCFRIPEGCTPESTAENACTAFSSWSLEDDNKVSIQLWAATSTYIAIGFSKSGGMADSDVYACTSNSAIVRSRNEAGTRTNTPAEVMGLSEEDIVIADGVISCSFRREVSLPDGEDGSSLPDGEDDSGNFFDLSAMEYTALLAWDGALAESGAIQRHLAKAQSASTINFLENSSAAAGSTEALAKLHGCLMLLAWIGFASIGITTARFFKKALPGELCGKPSWFAVHRSCMALVLLLTIIAFMVIVIHKGEYIKPDDGKIKFTHAIIGTIVVALACVNIVMALLRPHPGEPWRNLFNWAHWGVGVTAHLLAAVTVMLGTSNRTAQLTDVLLSSVPEFVFALVISLTFFHLLSWLTLTLIDIFRKSDSPNVTVHHHAQTDSAHASTNALADDSTEKEPMVKLVIYGIYVAVIVCVVAVMVLSVGIGKSQ